jgi:hypothetical protein
MRERSSVELVDCVRAAQTGDLVAYCQLVRATQNMVYAVCRRVLKDRSDALDATQEAYLRAYRGDPARHTAVGLGLGLERLASLYFNLGDIRMLEAVRV